MHNAIMPNNGANITRSTPENKIPKSLFKGAEIPAIRPACLYNIRVSPS